jgi:hypothetical protein
MQDTTFKIANIGKKYKGLHTQRIRVKWWTCHIFLYTSNKGVDEIDTDRFI